MQFGSHSRVVAFQKDQQTEKDSLKKAVETSFQDVFETPPAPFFLKIFSTNWKCYVDIQPEQAIPHKSLIQVMVEAESIDALKEVSFEHASYLT